MLINDITQLNPVKVLASIRPESVEEIINALKTSDCPISIGGGRFSMGGQVAYENSMHIDMRAMNKIIDYRRDEKIITVQAGTTWRDIQLLIDKDNLSIKIMQTYANFTVGGSLSVNAHGRYVCQGPLIYSVQSFEIILANGTLVHASPTENNEIFYGAIGGYGALGVITQVTLELVNNVKVERKEMKLDVEDYRQYFFDHIRQNPKAIFHNADLYPPHYKKARAITWFETEKDLTSPQRIVMPKTSYAVERYFLWAISESPLGKWRREHIFDPVIYLPEMVVWRNREASCYDINELEPRSRAKITYVLQEYFVPVMKFDEFLEKMTEILQRYNVNVLNISVRHANKDPGSFMAWAKEEVFAFVLYYKQGTDDISREIVALWTRELINAVIQVDGSYYLPYQPHATFEQFSHCYPKAAELFSLKKRVDPENRFRNKLWQKYYENSDDLIRTDSEKSEFKSVYLETVCRDNFFLFLQNVYNIYPEGKFHVLIKNSSQKHRTDQDIYLQIQKELPNIKPFMSDIRYAIPALTKQKKEMATQTLELIDKNKTYNGYVEIGSTGRYISELRRHVKIKKPIYLINDVAPGYSPVDIMERGSLFKIGKYIPFNDYDVISQQSIPDASVDLVTCYIGLHHCPLDRLEKFVQSIHRIMRPGAFFVIRDHDVSTPEMRDLVNLVHTVFNAGLGVAWDDNKKELRNFTSVADLSTFLNKNGFTDTGKHLLQRNDPSLNTLMLFIKS